MNVKRRVRLMSMALAVTVALSSVAFAANTIHESDEAAAVINELDAPVIVSELEAGIALGIGQVETEGVNIRTNPNTDADVVAVVAEGESVLILSQEGEWFWVSYGNINGFIHSDYVSMETDGTADLGYGMVTSEAVNIRAEADEESDVVDCLSEEDVVSIVGLVDGWYQVELTDGTEGYIRSDLVDPTVDIPAEKIFTYVVINCNAANLRSEASSDSTKTDVLYKGSLCTLIQEVGDWYKISYNDVTGYVLASLVTTTNSASDGSTSIETLNEALEREAEEAAAAKAAEEAAAKAAAAAAAKQSTSSSSSSSSSNSSGGSGSSC